MHSFIYPRSRGLCPTCKGLGMITDYSILG
jgi:hypothetical protein